MCTCGVCSFICDNYLEFYLDLFDVSCTTLTGLKNIIIIKTKTKLSP